MTWRSMDRYVFKLPDLGEGVVEGEIVAWHVQPDEQVEEDQPLLDVMTDKATVTIPSAVTGKVLRTHGRVGDVVPVGSELVVLEVDDGGSHSDVPPLPAVALPEEGAGSRRFSLSGERPEPASAVTRPLASPAVRRRARQKGVDLGRVRGTGREGRITEADVDAQAPAGGAAAATNGRSRLRCAASSGTTEVHISGLRRRIARKMAVSHTNIPHFSYIEEVDLSELAKLRRHLNEKRAADEPKLTYLPFLMQALVKALHQHPECNAHYDDQQEVVTRFKALHIGVATQTERGLYVPVIRHVEAKDLWESARELQRVTRAARDNTIRREELSGSTFTVTSLGRLGGVAATPIINHPEVAILGVNRAQDRPVVVDGQIVVRHMVNLSASFDHRVIDGADGAALIQCLKECLEHPATIFL